MQLKAMGKPDLTGFVVNMVPVPDLVLAVKEWKRRRATWQEDSLSRGR